jgi:hypothetical protein
MAGKANLFDDLVPAKEVPGAGKHVGPIGDLPEHENIFDDLVPAKTKQAPKDRYVPMGFGGVLTEKGYQPGMQEVGEIAVGAAKNLPGSAAKFAHDFAQVIVHPIDTATTLVELGNGIIQQFIPGEHPDEKKAKAVGEFFVKRYGSIKGIKNTMKTDPVGFAADVSTIAMPLGLIARAPVALGRTSRITNVAEKTGRGIEAAGRAIDPVMLTAKGVKAAAPVAGKVLSEFLGLTSGVGGKAIDLAWKSGKRGGAASAKFLEHLRDKGNVRTLIDEAFSAMDAMRTKRRNDYVAGMAGVKADNTVLNFRSIDDAIRDVQEIGHFKGQNINPKAGAAWEEILEAIGNWKQLDPSEFHTAAGLDALKQKVGNIAKGYDYGTPGRVVVDAVYHKIKDVINEQAPIYAEIMQKYEQASKELDDISRTLSANPKASVDTMLRKLQSTMRDNVNTTYGRRMELAEQLEKAGGKTLLPGLAGEQLATWTPRGLQRTMASGTALAGAGGMVPGAAAALPGIANPWWLAAVPAQMPRVIGEAAHLAGRGASAGSRALEMLGPTRSRAAALALYNAGRAKNQGN